MPLPPSPRQRVALLIETSNRYGRDLLHGIHDWVTAHNRWSLRLTEQARLAPLPAWIRDWEGDGIIARVDSPAIAAALRRTGLPVVDVSAERAKSEFPRMSIDNEAVARLAASHLFEKNLRHFAYCGDRRFLWSRERGRAFVRLVRQGGGACAVFQDAQLPAGSVGSDTELRTVADWLAGLPRPVGVFACYDGRARQVLEACHLLGLAVPDEVAVLGVDNDEVLCELCSPPLSSVLPNARRSGYEAAALLDRLMTGARAAAADSRLIEPQRVVERQSTDVVSVADRRLAAAVRHIREHAAGGLGVGDVLRAVPMSRTLLERKFREHFGHTPHRLIKQRQIERVRQLLIESDLPIARIADLAGFQSPSYLSAAFRRETGETPRAYRIQRRAGFRAET
jgi:LacI family transcriptional regulator